MPAFNTTPPPVDTIWGKPEIAVQRLPGIWHVTTLSHGGFVLSDERQAALPESLRLDEPYYEEDVDWTLVILGFEGELQKTDGSLVDMEASLAHQMVRSWRPDRYAAFTGEPVQARDSHVLRTRTAYEAEIGKIVVVSAFGDWADWVPEAKVGVIGRRLSGVNHLGQPSYDGPEYRALVNASRYEKRGIVTSFDSLDAELLP